MTDANQDSNAQERAEEVRAREVDALWHRLFADGHNRVEIARTLIDAGAGLIAGAHGGPVAARELRDAANKILTYTADTPTAH